MALEILVLAAGVGKRMRSSLPKVLQPLAGRPLLGHVLATARELAPRKVIVVHGHGAEAVREWFEKSCGDGRLLLSGSIAYRHFVCAV